MINIIILLSAALLIFIVCVVFRPNKTNPKQYQDYVASEPIGFDIDSLREMMFTDMIRTRVPNPAPMNFRTKWHQIEKETGIVYEIHITLPPDYKPK